MTVSIYGIANCDTIKKTKKWLDQANICYHFVDYREPPLSQKTLTEWIDTIGLSTLVNKRSTSWRQLTAEEQKQALDDTTAIPLLQQHPTLIKRPVLTCEQGIFVGFKESQYQDIFNVD